MKDGALAGPVDVYLCTLVGWAKSEVLSCTSMEEIMSIPTTEELTQRSQFIFAGTVVALQAATMSAVPITPTTMIVRVDEVVHAPGELGDYTGQEITVQAEEQWELQAGDQATFYTNGWLYGQSLAVRAIGVQEVRRSIARQRQRVTASVQNKADQELQEQLARANLVIVGKVVSVQELPSDSRLIAAAPSPTSPVSEHDPQWQQAVINVESVEKGELAEGTIVVPFPASEDVMWYQVPKFHTGQEGVFLLHTDQEVRGLARGAPTSLHPLDIQPRDQLERIRSFIGSLS